MAAEKITIEFKFPWTMMPLESSGEWIDFLNNSLPKSDPLFGKYILRDRPRRMASRVFSPSRPQRARLPRPGCGVEGGPNDDQGPAAKRSLNDGMPDDRQDRKKYIQQRRSYIPHPWLNHYRITIDIFFRTRLPFRSGHRRFQGIENRQDYRHLI